MRVGRWQRVLCASRAALFTAFAPSMFVGILQHVDVSVNVHAGEARDLFGC